MPSPKVALVVGINHYDNLGALIGCVKDAQNVAEVLRYHGDLPKRTNFDVDLLTCEKSGEAVSNEILRKAIQKLFKANADVALFYFAGHGYNDASGGFIIPSDVSKGYQGISLHDILTLSDGSLIRNKVIVLDSCHSGFMGVPFPRISNVSMLAEGTTVLTASTAEQYASADNGEGVFTRLFVDALEGGACNLTGAITPGSVYAYIDQSLGWKAQRPVFKTNVKSFVSLREVSPPIELAELRRIPEFFPTPEAEFQLDPSFEPERSKSQSDLMPPDPVNTAKFAVLQKYNRVNLVVPVDAPHMWHAAIQSKSCKLTSLGQHYLRLAERKLI
jgi:hypothetical protein